MRAIILCAATFTLGAIMSDAIAEEPKKNPKLDDKASYTDKVTVRQKGDKKLSDPIETVAFWGEVNKKKFLYVWAADSGLSKLTKGSEITETKSGDVWIVDKPGGAGSPFYICEVSKKP
jgi:hypothetical protein